MSEVETNKALPPLAEEVILSLEPSSLKARIWEKTGLDIGEGDPLQAAQVIYEAAMEDQVRLMDLQAKRMDKVFSDHLEIFHVETEAIVTSMKEEINAQTIQERMAVMSEQINRADQLAKSIKSNSRLFKILTFVNVVSLCAALTILSFVLS